MSSSKTFTPKLKDPATLARLGLLLFVIGVLTLHLLPHPTLLTSTLKAIPYDPRLNFMSEFVRTQYGPLMTSNFLLLAAASIAGVAALHAQGLKREAKILAIVGFGLVLLALFPTDLADLRVDGNTCADATRVEPCTWVGRVHNPLSSVVFGGLGVLWLSFAWRRETRWVMIVRAGWFCFALTLVLIGASAAYLTQVPETHRHWIGLMQRSVALGAITWYWLTLGHLRLDIQS